MWCVVCGVLCISHTWLRGTRIRSAPDIRPSKQPDHSNRDTTHHSRRLQKLSQKSGNPGRKAPAKSGRGYHLHPGKPVFLLQFLPFYFHLSNRSGRSWRPSYRLGLLRYTLGSLRSIHGRGSCSKWSAAACHDWNLLPRLIRLPPHSHLSRSRIRDCSNRNRQTRPNSNVCNPHTRK